MCAYSNGPYGIVHVQKGDDIGLEYEKELKKRTVRGIPGAEMTVYRDNKIETSLTDLKQIFGIVGVAYNNIMCNDIHEVANVYGIEAARHTILNEIRSIFGFYGIYVNVRHIMLVIDWITHLGVLTPMTRHGIRNMDQSPLKRSTFEEVVEVFNQAACYKEKDELNGISECIVMGIPPKMGTQITSVFTDDTVVERFKISPPTVDEQMDEMFEEECWLEDETETKMESKLPAFGEGMVPMPYSVGQTPFQPQPLVRFNSHNRFFNLSSVNLSLVNLSLVNLSLVNLSLVNLSLVNLSFVNLSSVNLSLVNLSSVNLSLVNLSSVKCHFNNKLRNQRYNFNQHRQC